MEKQELLKTLETLHADLSQAEQIDPEAERLLRAVTDDIHRLLDDREQFPADTSDTLSSQVQSLVLQWEADHPRIAQLLGRVADALSNLGI